jgi:hypothetical protein
MFLAATGMSRPRRMDEDALAAKPRSRPGRVEQIDDVLDVYREAGASGASNLDIAVLVQSAAMMERRSITLAERKLEGSTTPVWLYLLA